MFTMRRFTTTLAIALFLATSFSITAGSSSASAMSGKCKGLYQAWSPTKVTQVCLPAATGSTLTWQPLPVRGRTCVRKGTNFTTLTCTKSGSSLKWANLVPLEVSGGVDAARELARTMLADMHKRFYSDGDIIANHYSFKTIAAVLAKYHAKAGVTTTGYYISVQGQKTCFAANDDDPGMTDVAC